MKEHIPLALRAVTRKEIFLEALRKCTTLQERYDALGELLPTTWLLHPMQAREVVCYLQQQYDIDFGVCPFYEIEMDGDRQYCNIDGRKVECLCVIPQPYCVFRDKNGEPKYPKLLPSL